jgi:hypothetical protein
MTREQAEALVAYVDAAVAAAPGAGANAHYKAHQLREAFLATADPPTTAAKSPPAAPASGSEGA